MKKIFLFLIVSALTMPVIGEEKTADINKDHLELCKYYAKDEGISKQEMAEYITSCIEDLKESEKSAKE